MIRSKSVDQMMEHVMERHYHFDLTYITERIISVFFLPDLEEQQYCRNLQEVASMLKSKHQDKFLVSGNAERDSNPKLKPTLSTLCKSHCPNHHYLLIGYFTSKNRSVFFLSFFLFFPAAKFIRKEAWHHQTLPKGIYLNLLVKLAWREMARLQKMQRRHKKTITVFFLLFIFLFLF